MMEPIKVFESGSGKWVKIDDQVRVQYVSDEHQATKFDLEGLMSAHGFIEDFLTYRETLFAVPRGTNERPWNCDKVKEFLEEARRDGE